jgi:hypothetical protein
MKKLIFIFSLILSSSVLGNPQTSLYSQCEFDMLKTANYFPPDTISLNKMVGSSINNYNYHIKKANIYHYNRKKLVMFRTILLGISAGLGYPSVTKFLQAEDGIVLWDQLLIGFCSLVVGGTQFGAIVQQKSSGMSYYYEKDHILKAIEYYNTIAPIRINHIKGVQLP